MRKVTRRTKLGIVLDTDGKQVAQKYPKKDYRDVESSQTETERGLRLD